MQEIGLCCLVARCQKLQYSKTGRRACSMRSECLRRFVWQLHAVSQARSMQPSKNSAPKSQDRSDKPQSRNVSKIRSSSAPMCYITSERPLVFFTFMHWFLRVREAGRSAALLQQHHPKSRPSRSPVMENQRGRSMMGLKRVRRDGACFPTFFYAWTCMDISIINPKLNMYRLLIEASHC